jgi:hypothetical protein
MNNRLLIAGVISLLALSNCERQNIKPQTEGEPNSSNDYFIFGHTAGFCLNCDAVYKIQDGKLYGANHQNIFYPDSVQFKSFPDTSYKLVSSLSSEIPPPLLKESSMNIGTYFPDAGHYYIEVSHNHEVHHWYIEAGNTPCYLANFLKDVSAAMGKLE